MTKSQKPAPASVQKHPAPRDNSARPTPRTEGNLAKQPATPPRPQSETKPARFFKVRTDHH
jgi:hypothetical protein